MKHFLLSLSIFIIAFNSSIKAQTNLVPNHGFEIFDTCPYNAGQIKFAKKWFNPTTGTTDFFNSCYGGPIYVGSPFNFNGYQNPYLGNGYCGFMLSETVTWSGTYREYAGVKLVMPLTGSTKYYTSLFINLADSSRYATSRIGLLFTSDSIVKNYWETIGRIPQVQNPFGNFIIDKLNWIQLKGEFISNGNEEYLYIGNFYAQNQIDTLYVPNGGSKQYNNFPYYNIDEICVSSDSTYAYYGYLNNLKNVIKHSIKLFPNPFNTEINIQLEEKANDLFLEIYDPRYNILLKQKIDNEKTLIDAEKFAEGLYFVKIYSSSRNLLLNYKLTKIKL